MNATNVQKYGKTIKLSQTITALIQFGHDACLHLLQIFRRKSFYFWYDVNTHYIKKLGVSSLKEQSEWIVLLIT